MNSTIQKPSVAFDWDAPRFENFEACSAIGCNTHWLKNILSRRPAPFTLASEERLQVGDRSYFVFKFRTVFHLALMYRLARLLTVHEAREYAAVGAAAHRLFPADMSAQAPQQFLVIAPNAGVASVLSSFEPGIIGPGIDNVGGNPLEAKIIINATDIFDCVVEALDILEVRGELVE